MRKILGIDYGERRIGIAISDSLKIIASPLTVIDRKKNKNYFDTIVQIINEKNIVILIKLIRKMILNFSTSLINKKNDLIIKILRGI